MTRYEQRVQAVEEAQLARVESITKFMLGCFVRAVRKHVADPEARKEILREFAKYASEELGLDRRGLDQLGLKE